MINRYRLLWILALAACTAMTGRMTVPSAAHADSLGKTVIGETLVTVPANGEASIAVSAFCLNFGEPFPKGVTVSTARASDGVVKVMKAAAADGTGTSNVLQTQIAIWHAIEGEWGYKDKDVDLTVAKALADAAANQTTDPLLATGTALDKAIADGSVEATVDTWKQEDAPKALPSDAPYFGTGTLKIKNLTDKPLDVYVPLGLTLKAANEAEQDMGAYAVSSQEVLEKPMALPKTGAAEDRLVLWLALAGFAATLFGMATWARQRARQVVRG